MVTKVQVRVHRRGKNPDKSAKLETVVKDSNGCLWIHDGVRYWKLSQESEGGWHSINVGYPVEFKPV